jgi:predicted nucleic acid-binding protein
MQCLRNVQNNNKHFVSRDRTRKRQSGLPRHATNYVRLWKYARVREERLKFVDLIVKLGIWVEPAVKVSIVSADESDNRYLECALAGGGRYVVTGDQHLLELVDYQGIQLVLPATFITLLVTGTA